VASIALDLKSSLNALGDYVLQANTAKTGWFAISAMTWEKKVELARKLGRSGPNLVICRTKTENRRNHFVVPYERVAPLLVDETLSQNQIAQKRWEAWIDGDILRVTNSPHVVDLTPYFGVRLLVEAIDETSNLYPEELESNSPLMEGHVTRISVNRYERNREARDQCISIHKAICAVCSFDFAKIYGPVADGFIHVHHVKPISSLGSSYEVDPTKDLVPLCPNCHAVAHMAGGPYSIDDIKTMMLQAQTKL